MTRGGINPQRTLRTLRGCSLITDLKMKIKKLFVELLFPFRSTTVAGDFY